jgi:DNA-binding HxlR family transcriptional regulator
VNHDATHLVMKRIGEKWTYDVLRQLTEEPKRFREILRGIERVQTKVLSETLVRLEHDGFVRRLVEDDRPPLVRYQLSDLGRDLLDLMDSISVWAAKNHHRIAESHRRHEEGGGHP